MYTTFWVVIFNGFENEGYNIITKYLTTIYPFDILF